MTKTLELNDGRALPAFGLGTWKSGKDEVYRAVRTAIEAGYRHIDCAAVYGNEAEVGRAIREALTAGDVTRDALWVTSKLWNTDHRPEDVGPALEKTLADLQLDAVDLYLVHWPVALRKSAGFPFKAEDFLTLDEVPLASTWEAMAEQRERGRARSIGLSNMGPKRIDALTEAVGVAPAALQVESHPFLPQRELLELCKARKIGFTAYSPLGSGDRNPAMKAADEPPLLDQPSIQQIAEAHDASPAQILIAWQVQRGASVIPKSTNDARIRENLESLRLTLSPADMRAIGKLERGYRYIDGSFWCRDDTPYDVETLFG